MTASNNGSENYIASQDISDTTSQQNNKSMLVPGGPLCTNCFRRQYVLQRDGGCIQPMEPMEPIQPTQPSQPMKPTQPNIQDDSIVVAAIPEHDRDQYVQVSISQVPKHSRHHQRTGFTIKKSKQGIVKNKGTIQLKRVQPRVSPSRWAEGKGCLDLYCDQEHIRSIRFTKKSNTGHQENQGLPAIYEGAPNRTV
ncbi:hypothetical protein CLU79DRAFT_862856 [Phycomyces nitens]|nr:hypothetical protein CLU79DRAFT_722134 [Phycomyces nitens]KAI9020284.1 hypothetical protein CLU79DRAFT_862856 [Phycomyces nitens]